MVLQKQIIQDCKNQVIKNEKISDSNAKILFNTDEKFLKNLSDAANEITRFFQGKKIRTILKQKVRQNLIRFTHIKYMFQNLILLEIQNQ